MRRFEQRSLFGMNAPAPSVLNPNQFREDDHPLLRKPLEFRVRRTLDSRRLAHELELEWQIREKLSAGTHNNDLTSVEEDPCFRVYVPPFCRYRLFAPCDDKMTARYMISELSKTGWYPVYFSALLYFGNKFTSQDFPYEIIALGTQIKVPGHTVHDFPVLRPKDDGNWTVNRVHVGLDSRRESWRLLAWSRP